MTIQDPLTRSAATGDVELDVKGIQYLAFR